MKILITGSTGFIGYHLINHLVKQGHKITCLIRNSSNTTKLGGYDLNYINVVDLKRKKLI